MAEDREDTEQQEEQPKKKGKGKLIIIIAVVAVLVVGGVAAALLMGGSEEGAEDVEPEIVYERVDFGEFIVNLSSSTNFVKIKLIVEYDAHAVFGGGEAHGGGHGGGAHGGAGAGGGEAAAGLPGVFGEREAIIRDAIIRVLSSKTVEEVLSPEGKEELKEELVDAINEACDLDEDPAVAVYFQEFLVQ